MHSRWGFFSFYTYRTLFCLFLARLPLGVLTATSGGVGVAFPGAVLAVQAAACGGAWQLILRRRKKLCQLILSHNKRLHNATTTSCVNHGKTLTHLITLTYAGGGGSPGLNSVRKVACAYGFSVNLLVNKYWSRVCVAVVLNERPLLRAVYDSLGSSVSKWTRKQLKSRLLPNSSVTIR